MSDPVQDVIDEFSVLVGHYTRLQVEVAERARDAIHEITCLYFPEATGITMRSELDEPDGPIFWMEAIFVEGKAVEPDLPIFEELQNTITDFGLIHYMNDAGLIAWYGDWAELHW